MKNGMLLTVAVLSVAMTAAGDGSAFKVGFARVDVTPSYGVPMPGYFQHRVADGVLDPLVAECVALSDGTNTALVFSIDNLHLKDPVIARVQASVTAATGIPAELTYIHSTHIHTGPELVESPSFTPEENRLVRLAADLTVSRMTDAARTAIADLAPSRMAIATNVCRNISFVRRFRMKNGSVMTNPGLWNPDIAEPLDTPDESVQVVRFRREGRPDVAIVNFSTHPDTVGGTKYCADWPGIVRRTFEDGIGGGVRCLFLNGAQGDVNHHWIFPPKGRSAIARSQIHIYMGRAVAGAAMGVWDICEDVPTGAVRGRITQARAPANVPTADELKWIALFDAGKEKEIPLKGMELKTLTAPGSRVRRLKDGPDHFDTPVSAIAVGDVLAFVGFPGEPFTAIGKAVKAQSPFRMTCVSCLVNGSRGYFPSTAAFEQGGYEALSSNFAAPTGDLLVKTQVEQLKDLTGTK